MKAFSKAADDLHRLMDQYGSDDEEIIEKRRLVNERYRSARAKLTESLSEIDQTTEKASQFNKVIKDSHKFITSVIEKIEPKFSKGVPKDPKKMESIIQDIEVLQFFLYLCLF